MSDLGVQLPTTHDEVRALGSRGDTAAMKALAAAAAVDDQFLRRTALEVIGRHPKGHELSAIVLRAFRDPSEYVVRAACEIAGQWKLLEAHDLVLSHLANASGATRQTAIRALGAIWVETDFPLMFSIYAEDRETGVRREVAWVLRRRATPANWRTSSMPCISMSWPDTVYGLASLPKAFPARKSYPYCHCWLRTPMVTFERRHPGQSKRFQAEHNGAAGGDVHRDRNFKISGS